MRACERASVRACELASVRASVRACERACMRACERASVRACERACERASVRACDVQCACDLLALASHSVASRGVQSCFSTVPPGAVRHGCDAVQHRTVRHGAAQGSSVQHGAAGRSTVQQGAARCSAALLCTALRRSSAHFLTRNERARNHHNNNNNNNKKKKNKNNNNNDNNSGTEAKRRPFPPGAPGQSPGCQGRRRSSRGSPETWHVYGSGTFGALCVMIASANRGCGGSPPRACRTRREAGHTSAQAYRPSPLASCDLEYGQVTNSEPAFQRA